MLKTLLIISTFYVAAQAAGRMSFVTYPRAVTLTEDFIPCDALSNVWRVMCGLTSTGASQFRGAAVDDPFDLSEAVVLVTLSGASKIDPPSSPKTHSYEMDCSEVEEQLDAFVYSLHEQNLSTIDSDSQEFDKVKTSRIEAVIDKLEKTEKKDLPKAVICRMSAENQEEAAVIMNKLAETADKVYGGKATFVVINEDSANARQKRNVGVTRSDPIPESLNLALSYSDDYPVIFNIILWFSVVLAFSLLAISYTIGYMDPGRDSIIYRMTSTRMKKDN